MIALVATLMMALVAPNLTAGQPARTPAERDVQLFAESLDRALQARDKAALERMIGDGFEFVHSTAKIEDRASFIQRAAAGQLAMQHNPGETMSTVVHVFGETAIRTTRTAVRLNPSDTASRPTEFYTRDVFVKSAGSWQWISAQSTELAPGRVQ